MSERGARDRFAHPQRWPAYAYRAADRWLSRSVPDEQARERVLRTAVMGALTAAGLAAEDLPHAGPVAGPLGGLLGLYFALYFPVAMLSLHSLARVSRGKAADAAARGQEASHGQGRAWVLRARHNALLLMAMLLPLYAWVLRELHRRGYFRLALEGLLD